MIQQVKQALNDPIKNRLDIKRYVLELCNYSMNINCRDCINESVILLGNWLKLQGVSNDFKTRAINNEFTLKKMNLFVQVYESNNPERQKELDHCLRINKFLNINGVPYFNVIEIKERLTFAQMFELTKEFPNDINIIANSDIYFDETILQARFIGDKEAFALSRWDYLPDQRCVLFDRKDSQDVWIFSGEVKCNGGNYCTGIPGCDNKIAWELKQSGYNVRNPSKLIHAIHLHNTDYRTYTPDQRLQEPFHFIHPHY